MGTCGAPAADALGTAAVVVGRTGQVLVSIQSQVLNVMPLQNEPGLERSSYADCAEYNRRVRFCTAMVAILDAVPRPDGAAALPALRKLIVPELDGVVRTHLRLKREAILATMREWAAADTADQQQRTSSAVVNLLEDWQDLFEWWTWPRLLADLEAQLPT